MNVIYRSLVDKARFQAQFKQKINRLSCLIIYCLKCIRSDGNSTYKTGLILRMEYIVIYSIYICSSLRPVHTTRLVVYDSYSAMNVEKKNVHLGKYIFQFG